LLGRTQDRSALDLRDWRDAALRRRAQNLQCLAGSANRGLKAFRKTQRKYGPFISAAACDNTSGHALTFFLSRVCSRCAWAEIYYQLSPKNQSHRQCIAPAKQTAALKSFQNVDRSNPLTMPKLHHRNHLHTAWMIQLQQSNPNYFPWKDP